MDFSTYKFPQKKQGIQPTFLHDVVRQVCEYLYGCNANDTMCWRMWLGIGKRIGAGQLKDKLNYAKSRNIKSAKYLMACCRSL